MSDVKLEPSAVSSPEFSAEDVHWMQRAIELAGQGQALGEVPVGAVIVKDGDLLGEGFNQPISSSDPTAHAEVVALRQAAARVANYRLVDATIYVTLEPCIMCVGALVHARIARLIFGTTEPKAGAVVSKMQLLDGDFLNHRVNFSQGLLADQCQHQLTSFFALRRGQKREQKLSRTNASS